MNLLEFMNISAFEDFEDFSPEYLDPDELYSLLTDIAYEDADYHNQDIRFSGKYQK